MHAVDDFILSVMTRFQNCTSLGQLPDTAPTERAVQREQTLHTRVRDYTKLPAAA